MRYEFMSALVLAATVGACGDRVEGREQVSTIEIGSVGSTDAACAKFEVRGPSDTRELWERRAEAVLAGCPEQRLPAFDPEAE